MYFSASKCDFDVKFVEDFEFYPSIFAYVHFSCKYLPPTLPPLHGCFFLPYLNFSSPVLIHTEFCIWYFLFLVTISIEIQNVNSSEEQINLVEKLTHE